ncbi:hypothetical protein M2337_002024 [Sphingobium sp. B2D3A]|uniref:hypothetical protein n=1 Tax=Sphingobium TaxID=165695 RepID=UPI0015EB4F3E|nr:MULTISPECIES: hypothetical protein [Sphingobium]MCW2337791.1 hypothetical protein [Sphingobium sp. B2D3A]MCW2350579.1 hypothetical protein [Sphingobium sp. B12D2B]MCW2361995.1 hypothetical protein [Sphingobium sp. B10D3B]MCW2366212.1 hypothetical protein [Sphingobium sp. B7D2B]MCW2369681.1 hypothetical protein [Sphingobium sp. B11D3D]
MRYFLDTEYNGFGGALISLALVPEYGDQELYLSLLPLPEPLHPWVEHNVIPYLRHVPTGLDYAVERANASELVATYLAGDNEPMIVADWPEDIAHFATLLMTGPGEMIDVRGLRFELVNAAGFSSARNSQVPHNALHDARALRGFVLSTDI